MIHIYTQSGVWRCRPRDCGAGMQGGGSGGSDGSGSGGSAVLSRLVCCAGGSTQGHSGTTAR